MRGLQSHQQIWIIWHLTSPHRTLASFWDIFSWIQNNCCILYFEDLVWFNIFLWIPIFKLVRLYVEVKVKYHQDLCFFSSDLCGIVWMGHPGVCGGCGLRQIVLPRAATLSKAKTVFSSFAMRIPAKSLPCVCFASWQCRRLQREGSILPHFKHLFYTFLLQFLR